MFDFVGWDIDIRRRLCQLLYLYVGTAQTYITFVQSLRRVSYTRSSDLAHLMFPNIEASRCFP